MLKNKKIGIIGVGKIGGILVSGLLKNKAVSPNQILGSTASAKSNKEVSRHFGIQMFRKNADLVKEADVIILAVKPQAILKVLDEIKSVLTSTHLLITLAAAVNTDSLQEFLGDGIPMVRAMPNTPCLINEGITVLCPGKTAKASHLDLARDIFSLLGRVEILEQEELMDAVTALSGSGPAYAYIILESLAEGGVKAGLPRELATTLAAQCVVGGAKMVLETGEHPAKLKDSVITPAGVAIEGILELESGGIRVALIRAVTRATEKSKEISQELAL